MRRPSFQFYHGDWRSNANLRRCSFHERGVWIETMCLLGDSDEFGLLRWPLTDIAAAVGCKVGDLQRLVRKNVLKGGDTDARCEALVYTPRHAGKAGQPVVLIPAQQGPVWYSSRMVRDEYIRTTRASGGQADATPKGGFGAPLGDDPSRARVRALARSASSASSPSVKNQRRPAKRGNGAHVDNYKAPAAADMEFPDGTTPTQERAYLQIARECRADRGQLQLAFDEVQTKLERREPVRSRTGLVRDILGRQMRDGTFYGERAAEQERKRGGGQPLSAAEAKHLKRVA